MESTGPSKRKRDPVRFLVVGDFMADVYWFGHTTGLSAEAPIPKVAIDRYESFAGGAGNVFFNLQSLGAVVIAPEVRHGPGPIKNRMIVDNRQIARWDENDRCGEITKEQINPEVDRIVIADYNKGSINLELLAYLYELDLPTFVDTKCDPTIYVGWATAIFPNLSEYERYKEAYDKFERCVVTKGPDGAEVREFGKVIEEEIAYAPEVVSVCGAGDSFTACFAYRWPRKDALQFASLGAAVAVGKPLTATVTLQEISDLRRRLK